MSKKLVLVLVALSIFAMAFALAATPAPKKASRLAGAYFSKNNLIVKFDVFGFTKKDSMAASITVNQIVYPLSCKFDGSKHVSCVATAFNRFKGLNAHIWFADNVSYLKLPK